MGALKGTSSYLRFMVDGDPPTNLGESYEQAIEARRFLPLSADSSDDQTGGWVAIEAPYDDDIPILRDRFHFGDHIALAYREDKLAIPKSALVHHVKKRVEALEAAGEEITKQKRRAIELAVVAELRQKVLPKSRVMDVLWDTRRRELRVFGRGPMALERITACFERTFGLRINYASYATRAFALDLSMRARSILENLSPEHVFDDFAPPVDHSLIEKVEA
jgi:hypothetical protein